MTSILVATDDDDLIHDALRWCAAAAADPHLARSATDARRHWRSADAVLVDDVVAAALVDGGLPRRDGVLLVAEESAAVWRSALALGARAVLRPGDDVGAVESLASVVDGRGEACVLSVTGVVGGVGATTIAAVLARLAADRGHRTLLVDADPTSGGIDLVLGAEREPGLRWSGLGTGGRLPADGLAAALPARHGLSMLTWGRDGDGAPLASSVGPPSRAVISAAARGFDVVVADVPRQLDPFGAEVLAASVLTLLVVPEDVRGVAAGRRLQSVCAASAAECALVTVAGSLGPEAVAEALGLRALGRWRTDRRIGLAVERGHGPQLTRGARRTAAAVLDSVGLA